MSITFQEGVIVSTAKNVTTIITDAYMAVILVVFVLGPLVLLHGYRQWWVVTFYALFAIATVGGSIGRYRLVRRNKGADPATDH